MKDVHRQTRSHLMTLFKQFGFNPRGDLGQNFLIDVNLIELIVRSANLGPQDVVLEVGSGTGGMTAFLAASAGHVVSVEIDRNMFALASQAVSECDNVTLINNDILRNKNNLAPDITEIIKERLAAVPGSQLKLVANLPYSVATPVVSNLVASDLSWQRMVVTIQLELGEKMAAEFGSKQYSALTVWLQAQSSVRILRRLGPTVFWPRPKVESAIVSIWHDPAAAERIDDRLFFLDFVRRLFHQRRKLLRSVLTGMYRKQLTKPELDAILAGQGHAVDARAELTSVADLVALSNAVKQAIQAKTSTSGKQAPNPHTDETLDAD
jgi:16S rRNA (adenine1518-N6/adenine1519-N6)-dimethyltransferase